MKRFVTEYRIDGKLYGDDVDALDLKHAQAICDERGKGETVLGVLYAVIPASGFSVERADAMCAMFAETETGEPPDASEFDK